MREIEPRGRGWTRAAGVALAALALLALGAGAAQAAPKERPFEEVFEPIIQKDRGLAVEQASGDLLVLDAEANRLTRWHSDGTASDFAALGTNTIDGIGPGADETPAGGLSISQREKVQVAIDESGGAGEGDIYITQDSSHLVNIFSEDGEYLGRLADYTNGAAEEVPLGKPCGVSVGPDGSVYLGDSGLNEVQTIALPPSGTFKLGFEGEQTGWAGSGTLNGKSGSGDVTLTPVSQGERTEGSPTLKNVTNIASFKAGMRIRGTGIPFPTSVVSVNVAGGELTMDKNATSGGSSTDLLGGGIENATGGPFVVGEEVGGAGIATGTEILALSGGILTLSQLPTEAGSAVALAAGSRTVTGVGTSSGKLSKGEGVSGTGIQAGTTVEGFNEGAQTITLSKLPTSTGTSADLQADLRFDASATAIREALEKLSTLGAGNVSVGGPLATPEVTFKSTLGFADVPMLTISAGSVAETTKGVAGAARVYQPSSEPPADSDNTANFPLKEPCTLEAGRGPSEGFLFVELVGEQKLVKVNAATGEVKYPLVTSGAVTVDVNPLTGTVFSANKSVVEEFDASGASAPAEPISVTPSTLIGTQGIAIDAESDRLYVSQGGSVENVWVFGPAFILPRVTSAPASEIGTEAATLNGTVDPNGLEVEECFFAWGEGEALDEEAQCSEYEEGGEWKPLNSTAELGEGSGEAIPVRAALSGLDPGTKYSFRARAANDEGTSITGATKSFKTLGPPVVSGQLVLKVGVNGATLGALVNPEGLAGAYRVEYLSEAAYEANGETFAGASRAPAPDASIEAVDREAHQVSVQLAGLTPGAAYRWRVVATNSEGPGAGPAASFETFGEVPVLPACPNDQLRAAFSAQLPNCRAYEMVSPVNKAGADINVLISPKGNALARLDQSSASGEAFTYSSARPSATPPPGPSPPNTSPGAAPGAGRVTGSRRRPPAHRSGRSRRTPNSGPSAGPLHRLDALSLRKAAGGGRSGRVPEPLGARTAGRAPRAMKG